MASKIKFAGFAVKYFFVTKLFANAPEEHKALDKIIAHILLILCSAAVMVLLFTIHMDTNPIALAFGPICPTIIQEAIDFIKKLG